MVSCAGPFEFSIKSEQETNMKRTKAESRERAGFTRSIGSIGSLTTTNSGSRLSGASGSSSIDTKIDWLIKSVKEIKDKSACKKEIRMIIKEVVQEELGNVKKEIEDMRKMIQGGTGRAMEGVQKSYSEVVKEKKKENIIVKPKAQQESEITKKLIKEKIIIKNIAVGVTKLNKRKQGNSDLGL